MTVFVFDPALGLALGLCADGRLVERSGPGDAAGPFVGAPGFAARDCLAALGEAAGATPLDLSAPSAAGGSLRDGLDAAGLTPDALAEGPDAEALAALAAAPGTWAGAAAALPARADRALALYGLDFHAPRALVAALLIEARMRGEKAPALIHWPGLALGQAVATMAADLTDAPARAVSGRSAAALGALILAGAPAEAVLRAGLRAETAAPDPARRGVYARKARLAAAVAAW